MLFERKTQKSYVKNIVPEQMRTMFSEHISKKHKYRAEGNI